MAWYTEILRDLAPNPLGDRSVKALEEFIALRPKMTRMAKVGLEAKAALEQYGQVMPLDLYVATRQTMRVGNAVLIERYRVDKWVMDSLRKGIGDGRVTIEEAEYVRDELLNITPDQQKGLAALPLLAIVVALVLVGGFATAAVWLNSHAKAKALVQVEANRSEAWRGAYRDWLAAGAPGEGPSAPSSGGGGDGGGVFSDTFGTVLGGGAGIGVLAAVGVGAYLLLGRRR